MPNVITLDFKPGAIVGAAFQNVGNVFKGIFKNPVITVGKVGAFPVVLELCKALQHAVEAKVHRPHVQGSNLGLEGVHWHQTLCHQHGGRTSGGDIDHHI